MRAQSGLSFWVAAVLTLLVIVLVVGYFIPKLSKTGNQQILPGCAKNEPVKFDCPCNGIPVKGGYCCESGPSEKPCWCADEKVNICSDYKTEERCTANACGASPLPPFAVCRWSNGACT